MVGSNTFKSFVSRASISSTSNPLSCLPVRLEARPVTCGLRNQLSATCPRHRHTNHSGERGAAPTHGARMLLPSSQAKEDIFVSPRRRFSKHVKNGQNKKTRRKRTRTASMSIRNASTRRTPGGDQQEKNKKDTKTLLPPPDVDPGTIRHHWSAFLSQAVRRFLRRAQVGPAGGHCLGGRPHHREA